MPVSLLILALVAPTAPSASTPITVTGRPWAPFISPMGEAFRAHSATDDTLAKWFRQADADHDGYLTATEMDADARRFFATLDTEPDGQIDPDELAHYEWEIAPEIQVMSRTRRLPGQPPGKTQLTEAGDERPRGRRHDEARYAGLGLNGELQGAARYSLLNMPEPVAAADADFNRAITLGEFRQAALARFQLLDKTHQGLLSIGQLEALPHAPTTDRRKNAAKDAKDERVGNPLPPGP